MSDVAIRVEGLGKRYRRGLPAGHDRLSEVMANAARGLMAFPRRLAERFRQAPGPYAPTPDRAGEFWALKDVSFEVKRGEVVGVIGRNGAGKSTLLKVLSRITEPTAGRFGVAGRVASLLEVGTGFHGELTGRENVFLSGSLLGMSRAEVRRKFDAIAAFAEVDGFLDTPVKRYSSGMQMRLGFAVAAHLEPDILIVDEVLAVGDAAFQKKCLGKMQEVACEGQTVLFVSHNMTAVRTFSSSGVWLESGQVRGVGDVNELLAAYSASPSRTSDFSDDRGPRSEWVALVGMTVSPVEGDQPVTISTPFRIEIDFRCLRAGGQLNLSLAIRNQDDVHVCSVASVGEKTWDGKPFEAGLYRSICEFTGGLLNDGQYSIEVWFVLNRSVPVLHVPNAVRFSVEEGDRVADRGGWLGKWGGVIRPRCPWRTEFIGPRGTE